MYDERTGKHDVVATVADVVAMETNATLGGLMHSLLGHLTGSASPAAAVAMHDGAMDAVWGRDVVGTVAVGGEGGGGHVRSPRLLGEGLCYNLSYVLCI